MHRPRSSIEILLFAALAGLIGLALACSSDGAAVDASLDLEHDQWLDALKDGRGEGTPGDIGYDITRKPFACGDTLTCKVGEYCEEVVPGECGGTPLLDSGVCPPDCQQDACPDGTTQCTCHTYSCYPLPKGCASCDCVTPGPGCYCTKGREGEIQMTCSMP